MIVASSFAAFSAFSFVLFGALLGICLAAIPLLLYGLMRRRLFDQPDRWWKFCLAHLAVIGLATILAVPLAQASKVSAADWTTDGMSLFVFTVVPIVAQIGFFTWVVIKRPRGGRPNAV